MVEKLGYPCLNWQIGCNAGKTFRLASYTSDKFIETVENNLDCLLSILEYNKNEGFMFFRISSDTIPFASHEICDVDWVSKFSEKLQIIGDYIKKNNFRISMHPDQFVVINSPKKDIVKKSIAELEYHADLLDAMGLDNSAKIQIHVGGVYGDKDSAISRFIENYNDLPLRIKNRLCIENDERMFGILDCMRIHEKTGIPIIFDVFHHSIFNDISEKDAFKLATSTWKESDGVLMVDYSSQEQDARVGTHSHSIDIDDFQDFVKRTNNYKFDCMLEIKDKEKSAKLALEVV